MKVVYEPNEVEQIETRHAEFVKNGFGGLLFSDYEPDRLYGITFKVTNPALATYILGGLLHNRLNDFELGIDIKSINFNILDIDPDHIKEKLHAAIDEIM